MAEDDEAEPAPEPAPSPAPVPAPVGRRVPTWRFVAEMLYVGGTGFGGFLQLRLRQRLVERLGWLTDDEFGEAVTTANIAPGGPSTALIVELGRRVSGPVAAALGLLVSLLPGTVVVLAIAGTYHAHRDDTGVQGFLQGAAAGGLAVLVVFVVQLWHTFGRRPIDVVGGAVVFGLACTGLPLALVLLLGIAVGTVVVRRLEAS